MGQDPAGGGPEVSGSPSCQPGTKAGEPQRPGCCPAPASPAPAPPTALVPPLLALLPRPWPRPSAPPRPPPWPRPSAPPRPRPGPPALGDPAQRPARWELTDRPAGGGQAGGPKFLCSRSSGPAHGARRQAALGRNRREHTAKHAGKLSGPPSAGQVGCGLAAGARGEGSAARGALAGGTCAPRGPCAARRPAFVYLCRAA